jgi:hypothetical protein
MGKRDADRGAAHFVRTEERHVGALCVVQTFECSLGAEQTRSQAEGTSAGTVLHME